MKQYIVAWILAIWVSTPNMPEPDKYGRTSNRTYATYSLRISYQPHYKVFENRKDAFSFYDSAKMEHDLQNVAIDSICNFCNEPFANIDTGIAFWKHIVQN